MCDCTPLEKYARARRALQIVLSRQRTATRTTMQWVDLSKTSLLVSLASITFNPLAWNIVARNGKLFPEITRQMAKNSRSTTEYRNKTITRIFGGNAKAGCYFLAAMIFSFGILRDSL